MKCRHNLWILLAILFIGIMPVPDGGDAYAAPKTIDFATFGTDFFCSGIAVGGGKLFDTTMDTCDPDGTQNLFSYSICMFENIIDDIMGNLYCGFRYALETPFLIMMLLFTAFFGGAVLSGIIPLNAVQGAIFLFKFALVFVFALDSSMTISVLYQGLMYFVQESVVIVMEAFGLTVSGTDGVLEMMDGLLAQFINNNTLSFGDDAVNTCAFQMIALFTTLLVAVPGLSGIILITAFQFLMVFFRTVLGYLVAITGIMFLTTLAPLFLSMALFKTTQDFFVAWLQSLISFALQMFIVFAMIGIVLSLNIGEQLNNLYEIAVPHSQVIDKNPVRIMYDNVCTICKGTVEQVGRDMIYRCELDAAGNKIGVTDPQSLTMNADFFMFVMLTLGKIFFLAFVAETAIGAAPSIARALAGSPSALNVTNPYATEQNLAYSKEESIRAVNKGAASATSSSGGSSGLGSMNPLRRGIGPAGIKGG